VETAAHGSRVNGFQRNCIGTGSVVCRRASDGGHRQLCRIPTGTTPGISASGASAAGLRSLLFRRRHGFWDLNSLSGIGNVSRHHSSSGCSIGEGIDFQRIFEQVRPSGRPLRPGTCTVNHWRDLSSRPGLFASAGANKPVLALNRRTSFHFRIRRRDAPLLSD
jgi:hypothetical protein